MKILSVIAAAALTMPIAAPVAANAQSIADTHVLVWHPAGKTPSVTYRPRGKPACTNKFDDHRAGKGQYRVENSCNALEAAAEKSKADKTAMSSL